MGSTIVEATEGSFKMDESLKVFVKQWVSNAEEQPGWIYLLAACYLLLRAFGVPHHIDIGPWRTSLPQFSAEVWATVLTLLLYQIGDALDKVTFKKRNKEGTWVDRFQPPALKMAREAACQKLGVRDGIYRVSMKILEQADKAKFSVRFLNEITKFFRSLIVPALVVAIVLALRFSVLWASVLIVLAFLCAYLVAFYVYPQLKNLHIINLYKSVVALPLEADAKITTHELDRERMFFWDGVLVVSATNPKSWPVHAARIQNS
jgi:hypothetical protein